MPLGKEAKVPTEGTRRSSRVVPTAAAPVAPASRKRATKAHVDSDVEDDEDENEDSSPPPKRKKAKKIAEAMKNENDAEADEDQLAEDTTPTTDIGETLPELTLKNEKDEDVNIKELATAGLVLFCIPKADTPGCTTQACAFRDSYADFTRLNYAVYCLSHDTTAALTKWQTKKELPYPLLSDPQRKLIRQLGAGTAKKTKRSHFIFEKETGKLIEKKVPVTPAVSTNSALAFLNKLHKKAPKDGETVEPEEDEKEE